MHSMLGMLGFHRPSTRAKHTLASLLRRATPREFQSHSFGYVPFRLGGAAALRPALLARTACMGLMGVGSATRTEFIFWAVFGVNLPRRLACGWLTREVLELALAQTVP